uniref:Uncharacterized protein n=1 Tax=Anguilla anguilla TaxID=7936 RepID=A0A0E9R1M2_ANGAN
MSASLISFYTCLHDKRFHVSVLFPCFLRLWNRSFFSSSVRHPF